MPNSECLNFIMIFWTMTFIVKTLRSSKPTQTANYLAITAENLKDLIKPELCEEFERNKHNLFVTPLAPQHKHTPGLFKVELKGHKMIGFCSKSYCTKLFATENSSAQIKFSMKGVNKGQFKNPMPHYEHILNYPTKFLSL